MQNNYTYPILIDYSEKDIININIPDFKNAYTCTDVGENYISEAQDLLALTIADFEDNGKDLPIPSLKIKAEGGQKLVYVNVWMPYHRSNIKEVFVKKTLTIPSWLNILAKDRNVNFSSILVEALKKELVLK